MGYKGFWRGRPELTGTPAYAGNWLMLDRPAIHEGFGPLGHDPIGSMVERRAGGQALAGRREALEAEGGWLGEVTEYPGEEAVKSMFPSGLLPQGSQFRGVVFGD